MKVLIYKYINIRSSNTTLKKDIVKRSLDSLHDNFARVPADNANGNIVIICKHFYMQVVNKKLGIDNKLIANSTCKYLPSERGFYSLSF